MLSCVVQNKQGDVSFTATWIGNVVATCETGLRFLIMKYVFYPHDLKSLKGC